MLEYSLIKQHQPRFNIRLKDDKSYPFLAVTLDDEWPRPMVMRGAQAQGRPLLRALRPRLRHPRDARPAAAHVPAAHLLGQQVRPPRAPRPAVPAVPHREVLRALRRRGRPRRSTAAHRRSCSTSSTATPTRSSSASTTEMQDGRRRASSSSRRPACATGSPACEKAIEKQQMVAERNEDLDVIGLAEDELEAAVQVFFVRKGRVVGRKGFIARQGRGPHAGRADRHRARGPLRRPAARHPEDGARARPRRTTRRCTRSGCRRCAAPRSTVRVPQRGDKRELQETVTRNAKEEFARHRLRRASDHNSRARALNELQDAPRPARGPAAHRVLRHEPHPGHRLRGLDGGARGRPARRSASTAASRSRASRATTTSPPWRRCSPAASPPTSPSGAARRASTPGKFAYPPQLLLVDGGKGQLGVAVRVLEELGPGRRDPGGLAGQAVRGGLRARARPTRSASPASPRRSTCCSASATRPTASPSPTTASCAASA